MPEGRYDEVVEMYSDERPRPGDIISADGKLLGSHSGIHRFTIGQRRGLGIAAKRPLYVVALDAKKRQVRVGFKEECSVDGMIVKNVSWNEAEPPAEGLETKVKIRHQGREIPAGMHPITRKKVKVIFDSPQVAVTPGQAAVFYRGEIVSGGGWISSVA